MGRRDGLGGGDGGDGEACQQTALATAMVRLMGRSLCGENKLFTEGWKKWIFRGIFRHRQFSSCALW